MRQRNFRASFSGIKSTTPILRASINTNSLIGSQSTLQVFNKTFELVTALNAPIGDHNPNGLNRLIFESLSNQLAIKRMINSGISNEKYVDRFFVNLISFLWIGTVIHVFPYVGHICYINLHYQRTLNGILLQITLNSFFIVVILRIKVWQCKGLLTENYLQGNNYDEHLFYHIIIFDKGKISADILKNNKELLQNLLMDRALLYNYYDTLWRLFINSCSSTNSYHSIVYKQDNKRQIMEFKKHFSSNLQNLSVKKTLILNPPPNITHHHYAHSQIKQQSLSQHQSPYQSRYSSNKQNKVINQPSNDNYANNAKNSRKGLRQNSGRDNTPILTFNKIKRNAIQMMENGGRFTEEHNRKLLKPIQNNGPKSNNIFLKKDNYNTDSSKRLHSFTSNLQNNNKSVRLGSMVFANLVKKDIEANKQKSPIRQSRSYDRLANLQTQRSEIQSIQCMNNDGQHAKYKVIKNQGEQYQQQLLYYCFNCAICLVKQGFSIEELTSQDRKTYKLRYSNYMSKSDFYKQDIQSSRYSLSKPIQNDKIKIGQQIKCKIIMKLNKIKVNREQFNKTIESHLQNIDYFYHSLANYIEQQRVNDRQDIIRIKNIKKSQPENYQSQLSSHLGTIDYMMKNLQGVNYDFLREVQNLLDQEVLYPKMRINLEPFQGFQKRIDKFAQFFQSHLKICLEETQPGSIFKNKHLKNGQQLQEQLFHHKTNSLRFSFEQALKKSSKKMSLNEMNPLYQENESQLDESMPVVERRQNAFRNLFPQENDQYEEYSIEKVKQSPMFKQF